MENRQGLDNTAFSSAAATRKQRLGYPAIVRRGLKFAGVAAQTTERTADKDQIIRTHPEGRIEVNEYGLFPFHRHHRRSSTFAHFGLPRMQSRQRSSPHPNEFEALLDRDRLFAQ